MTVVARPSSGTGARRDTDPLRCTGHAPGRPPHQARCQLLAGHVGPHALLYVDERCRRTVRSWSTSCPERWVDSREAFQRPWATGFPRPAWSLAGD